MKIAPATVEVPRIQTIQSTKTVHGVLILLRQHDDVVVGERGDDHEYRGDGEEELGDPEKFRRVDPRHYRMRRMPTTWAIMVPVVSLKRLLRKLAIGSSWALPARRH